MPNRFNGLLDKLIADANEKKSKFPFHYSEYWGTWSRVLVSSQINKHLQNHTDEMVEINLTPINPLEEGTWEDQVIPIVFRRHVTTPDVKDQFTDKIPQAMVERMKEKLGYELALRLLTEDWLPLIDLEKLRTGTGGKSLEEIQK